MNFHTHLTTSLPNLASAEQKINSRICGFLSLGWETQPRPAAPPNFTICTGSYHSISVLICLPWQEEKRLESFTCEQTKRWSTSNPFSGCRFLIHLQMKAQLASKGWAGASLHQCQAPPQHSTQPCEAEQLQEAQAAHRLNTISSQGSKMIIDFILIGLSAMSQFKC